MMLVALVVLQSLNLVFVMSAVGHLAAIRRRAENPFTETTR